MADLEAWKSSEHRRPLILRGVRQCGKTWVLREFGRRCFDDVLYLNLEQDEVLRRTFLPDLDPSRIIEELGIYRGRPVDPATTLIILDEIQESPEALTSLKYFSEDRPDLHVVAAGSLLGLSLAGPSSFPVGKVDFLKLFPLTVDEVMRAQGDGMVVDALAELSPGDRVPPAIAKKAEQALRLYMLTGGMPEVVTTWLETGDIAKTEERQQAIVDSYALDMVKHAPPSLLPKLLAIWRSIPRQLARENTRFVFSQVKSGWRAKDLEDALEWLLGADITAKLVKIDRPAIPLSAFADDRAFKLFLGDVGLLRTLAAVPASSLIDRTPMTAHIRGAMAENYVLSHLRATGIDPYYWRSENSAEVDFVIQHRGEVVPIEVKSADNTASKSLAAYRRLYQPEHSLKMSLKPTLNGHLPLYLAWNVAAYLDRS
jgi:predicted AAA+ superfamily ATPase